MDSIKLLIGASKSISEDVIRKRLLPLRDFSAESVSFVDNGSVIRRVVSNLWPAATSITISSSSSLLSSRRAVDGCSHLVLLWDGEDLTDLLFESRVKKKRTKLIPVQVTKVVNKRDTDRYDVYIGRGTPWGNPFAISHDDGPDRDEVIEKYREFFNKKIESDNSFRSGILAMKGLRLACFCKPAPCHGDVISGYLDSLPDMY